jgi:hypothetical protein
MKKKGKRKIEGEERFEAIGNHLNVIRRRSLLNALKVSHGINAGTCECFECRSTLASRHQMESNGWVCLPRPFLF